jgi:hypothetical protein
MIFTRTGARSSPYARAHRPRNGAGTPHLTPRAVGIVTHDTDRALLFGEATGAA